MVEEEAGPEDDNVSREECQDEEAVTEHTEPESSWRDLMPVVPPPLPLPIHSTIDPLSDQDNKVRGNESADVRPSSAIYYPSLLPSTMPGPKSDPCRATLFSELGGMALKKLWRPQDMMAQQMALRGVRGANLRSAFHSPGYWADVDQSFSTVSPASSSELPTKDKESQGAFHTIEAWRRKRQELMAGIQDAIIATDQSDVSSSLTSTP